MDNLISLEELKDLGSGKPATSQIARLDHEAFAEFSARALWNRREIDRPTIAQPLAVADSLRVEGNLQARSLAIQIEAACRAAL